MNSRSSARVAGEAAGAEQHAAARNVLVFRFHGELPIKGDACNLDVIHHLDALLARDRRAHQGVQLAAAFGGRGVQARHGVAGRGDGRGEVHVDAGGVGEEVRGVGGARGDRVDDRLVRAGAALGADVAREGRPAVVDAGGALPARAGAGKQAAAHQQVGGPGEILFQQQDCGAALRRGERAHHPRRAGADHDRVRIEHAR